jgi:hypothetical protein
VFIRALILAVAAVAALALAGCGGSSTPTSGSSSTPTEASGAAHTGTAVATTPNRTGTGTGTGGGTSAGGGTSTGSGTKTSSGSGFGGTTTTHPSGTAARPELTAVEYEKLKASLAAVRHQSPTGAGVTRLLSACAEMGNSTRLLATEQRACAKFIPFAAATLEVGTCFKRVTSVATLAACGRKAGPVAPAARAFAATVGPLNAAVRKRGFSKVCAGFLGMTGAVPADLDTVSADTNTLVAAASQHNLLAIKISAERWAGALEQFGKALQAGPSSIKVCPHT